MAWSKDGKYLATVEGQKLGNLIIWDTINGKRLWTLGPDIQTALAWAPNGKILAAAGSNDITLWDTLTGAQLDRFAYAGNLRALDWSGDGKMLAGSYAD